jgi:hypothetical protein
VSVVFGVEQDEALKKTRRRVEDALRKTKDKSIIIAVAKFLGVDDQSIRRGKIERECLIAKLLIIAIQGSTLFCFISSESFLL